MQNIKTDTSDFLANKYHEIITIIYSKNYCKKIVNTKKNTNMDTVNLHTDLEIALQTENTELKADLKQVKTIFMQMASVVGMVNDDGTINEKIKVKHIIGEVGHIMTSAMNPFGNKSELEERFSFLKEIVPIYEKYKHL